MESQDKLNKEEEKDEFVESLNLTPKKIKEDMDKMKEMEGFPLGDDDDILNLSNPPYYTAYPNPYIKAFIEKFGKKYDEKADDYHREPYVGDVSEGKNDPYYNLHTYHTKVPYKAITPFLTHYTQKGDLVFDGFCGSGMTGVASSLIGRHSILLDLSPSATFISANTLINVQASEFQILAEEVLGEALKEIEWLYKTKHPEKEGVVCDVNFFVWNDLYECPFCKNEISIYDIRNEYLHKINTCESCKNELPKTIPRVIDKNKNIVKSKLVLINYTYNGKSQFKKPDDFDYEILRKLEVINIPYWYPTNDIPKGFNTEQPRKSHLVKTIPDFYTKRNLYAVSCIWNKIENCSTNKDIKNLMLFWFQALSVGFTKLNRFFEASFSQVNRYLKGTLYIAPKQSEVSLNYALSGKLRKIGKIKQSEFNGKSIVSTGSSTKLNFSDNTIDYIFVDPPFGGNLMYSELNFIWESWLRVTTQNDEEAIINEVQHKTHDTYQNLIIQCFKEFYRILKPNRWMTVEFHNSSAEIWKIIQNGIAKSGFIIAQISVLDKQQMTMKQYAYATSVKNDLVINAYKSSESFRTNFLKKAGLNMELEFIKMHLDKLPIEPNIERTQQMLYSKLLAQYIQNGFEVRMDASEFYSTLRNHFTERDNFWFNSDQIQEYEKRLKLKQTVGKADLDQTIIGIDDEKTAIIWLASFLRKPRTYDEIYIEFSKKIMTSEDKMPELKVILEENFVTEDGAYHLPSIGQKKEREDTRIKRLLKEFQDIIASAVSGKKITEVRKEALLVGLMKLYNEKNVDQIKLLGKKLDKKIIESDDDINAIVDWAMAKGD
jgi:DNA modification methylase